jgi:hypothetical protein
MSKELLNQEQKELPHPKCEFKVQNNSSLSKLKENKK